MTESVVPPASSAGPPTTPAASNARARTAVTLGAAFTLLCAALFGLDTPESFAAGGLFDLLFGGGQSYVVTKPFFGGGSGVSRRHYSHNRRHARHARRYHARYAYAHRQMVERRRAGVADRRDDTVERRAGLQSDRHGGSVERVSFAEMPATTPEAVPQTLARRTVCVRACDGYFFPIANLKKESEIAVQQATCTKLCPGAQARLFVLPAGSDKIEDAMAARGGEAYAALLARVNGSDAKSQSCGCQMNASAATHETWAFRSDFTLRPGDSVVTPNGVRVLRRGSRFPYQERDFVSLAETRDVPVSSRRTLIAIERVLNTPHGRLLASNNERRHMHRRDPRQ